MNKIITSKEAGEILNCGRANISYLIKHGKLTIRDGGITLDSVEYHKAHKSKGGRPLGSYKTK